MKKLQAFFIADCLLALFVFLIGTSAILAVYKSSERAYFNHKVRQKAWQILWDAESWQRDPDTLSWTRKFNFQGEPDEDDGFFILTSVLQGASPPAFIQYTLRYKDGEDLWQQMEKQAFYWRDPDESL